MERDPSEFIIRRVTESDGSVLSQLAENNPDSGDISIAPQYATNPYDLYTTLCPDTAGFLAETPDGQAVGMGFVSFKRARVNGSIRKIAYLRGLVVKREFRRRGLGKRLARTRINHARRERDEDRLIVATIQRSNEPSRAVVASWADALGYTRRSWTVKPRTTPVSSADYEIRRADINELPTIVERANEFYADAELFSPYTADTLGSWLSGSGDGRSFRQYIIACDGNDVVAGVDVIDFHKERWLAVEGAESIPSSLPESGEIRPRRIANPWFLDGYEDAARAVIEAARTDPDGANRIWFQSDENGPFTELINEIGTEVLTLTTAVQGVERLPSDHPIGDLF